MESGITTIYFDGQYWVALAEQFPENGTHLIARFTFGPDPSYNDMLDFYIRVYPQLKFRECTDSQLRIKPKRLLRDVRRNTTKAQLAFGEAQKKYLEEKKQNRTKKRKETQQERFNKKQYRKKQKHRGH